MQQTPPWYVLTGGPCAGKTTTLNELMRQGHPVLAEAARLEIDTKMAAGMAIEQIVSDPDWPYSVVRRSYAQENQMPTNEQWFLDRSTVDSLAYFKKFGTPVDELLARAVKEIRYRKVFLLDLIDYATDYARPETPEEARMLHEMLKDAYVQEGYEVVPVPVMPVQERVQYILARL